MATRVLTASEKKSLQNIMNDPGASASVKSQAASVLSKGTVSDQGKSSSGSSSSSSSSNTTTQTVKTFTPTYNIRTGEYIDQYGNSSSRSPYNLPAGTQVIFASNTYGDRNLNQSETQQLIEIMNDPGTSAGVKADMQKILTEKGYVAPTSSVSSSALKPSSSLNTDTLLYNSAISGDPDVLGFSTKDSPSGIALSVNKNKSEINPYIAPTLDIAKSNLVSSLPKGSSTIDTFKTDEFAINPFTVNQNNNGDIKILKPSEKSIADTSLEPTWVLESKNMVDAVTEGNIIASTPVSNYNKNIFGTSGSVYEYNKANIALGKDIFKESLAVGSLSSSTTLTPEFKFFEGKSSSLSGNGITYEFNPSKINTKEYAAIARKDFYNLPASVRFKSSLADQELALKKTAINLGYGIADFPLNLGTRASTTVSGLKSNIELPKDKISKEILAVPTLKTTVSFTENKGEFLKQKFQSPYVTTPVFATAGMVLLGAKGARANTKEYGKITGAKETLSYFSPIKIQSNTFAPNVKSIIQTTEQKTIRITSNGDTMQISGFEKEVLPISNGKVKYYDAQFVNKEKINGFDYGVSTVEYPQVRYAGGEFKTTTETQSAFTIFKSEPYKTTGSKTNALTFSESGIDYSKIISGEKIIRQGTTVSEFNNIAVKQEVPMINNADKNIKIYNTKGLSVNLDGFGSEGYSLSGYGGGKSGGGGGGFDTAFFEKGTTVNIKVSESLLNIGKSTKTTSNNFIPTNSFSNINIKQSSNILTPSLSSPVSVSGYASNNGLISTSDLNLPKFTTNIQTFSGSGTQYQLSKNTPSSLNPVFAGSVNEYYKPTVTPTVDIFDVNTRPRGGMRTISLPKTYTDQQISNPSIYGIGSSTSQKEVYRLVSPQKSISNSINTGNFNFNFNPARPTRITPTWFPSFNLGAPFGSARSSSIGSRGMTGYIPSYTALAFNIRGKQRKTGKYASGFEFRPITSNWWKTISFGKINNRKRKRRL